MSTTRRHGSYAANALLALTALCAASCGRGEEPAAQPAAAGPAAPQQAAVVEPAEPAPPPAPAYDVRPFPTEAEALAAIMAEAKPAILGFGEYHQLDSTAATRSAISRFTGSLLPLIAPDTSDLVVETWVSAGSCGQAEKQVVKNVEEVSERPAETADETVLLLKRAQALGVAPHILGVTCDDYARVLGGDGGLDYFAFLELVATRLGDRAAALAGAARKAGGPRKAIAIYGGAMHNDVAPRPGFEPVSFAARMRGLGAGPYAEIDFLVPEFLAGSNVARSEPWFETVMGLASKDHASLVARGDGSYIILARAGQARPPR